MSANQRQVVRSRRPDRLALYALLIFLLFLLWVCGEAIWNILARGDPEGLVGLLLIIAGLPLAAGGLILLGFLFKAGRKFLVGERLFGYLVGILSFVPIGFLAWKLFCAPRG